MLLLLPLYACSDDGNDNNNSITEGDAYSADTSDDENDSGSSDVSEEQKDAVADVQNDAADSNSCGEGDYRDPITGDCTACPASAFSCDSINIEESVVDVQSNIVTVSLAADFPQVLSARASGMKKTGGGLGGSSEPIFVDGTVNGNILTFDFSEFADANELQMNRVHIQLPCSDEEATVLLIARWEPGVDGSSDGFMCM
jgi:hypothetical protein